MCIDILKNPVAAVMKAKKKNMGKTAVTLIESCILFGLTAAIVIMQTGGLSQTAVFLAAVSFTYLFVLVLVASIVFGYVLKIIATTLGGSGKYYEGLTVVAYTLVPISAAMFVASILSFLPVVGVLLNIIVLSVGFALGVSLLYRSIKELFRTDMVVALVAVSVLVIVLFIAATVSFGLSTLTQLGGILPMGA